MNREQRRASKREVRHGGRTSHALDTIGMTDVDLICREIGFDSHDDLQRQCAADPELHERTKELATEKVRELRQLQDDGLARLRILEEEIAKRELTEETTTDVEDARARLENAKRSLEGLEDIVADKGLV